jgi:hypothetical protein
MQLDYFHFDQLDKLIAMVVACGGEHVSVSGGAVRDSVLEKPIKDIDVFYQGELNEEAVKQMFGEKNTTGNSYVRPIGPLLRPDCNVYTHEGIVNPLWNAYFDQENAYDAEEDAAYDDDFEVSSYNGDSFSFDGKVIQLIKVEDVDKAIAEFPCILSRMLYSEGNLVIPKEAIKDACLGIVSFTDTCNENYKDRIMAKYDDYA